MSKSLSRVRSRHSLECPKDGQSPFAEENNCSSSLVDFYPVLQLRQSFLAVGTQMGKKLNRGVRKLFIAFDLEKEAVPGEGGRNSV